jgi:L-alanine-DL-glutamate epimerase-like enolase superfamily enzyme
VKITAIRPDRMRLPPDPPFRAAWDPVPRRHFDATLVRVETDEGITGFGSGDTEIMVDLNQWWRMAGDISPALDVAESRRDFFLSQPRLADSGGCLAVPAQPGLGADIDESAVTRWALR